MNEIKYFLVVESGCQWQSAIISCIDNDKSVYAYNYLTKEHYNLDFSIKGKLLDNICSRELHFGDKLFDRIGRCYGWTLSKNEFDKLKRAVELKPLVEEYTRLVNS